MRKVYLIATIVAIATGFATYFFATSLEKKTHIKDAPTSDVVVAIVDIPENKKITAEMVQLKRIVNTAVAVDSARKLEDVVGKLNKYPVSVGEQISIKKIVELGNKENNAALSNQLADGEYAFTIDVNNVTGVSGYITRGDYVDIIFHGEDENGQQVTKYLFEKIRVIKVSNYAANYTSQTQGVPITSYAELVISVNHEQALELAEALTRGTIRLILDPITVGNIDGDKVKTTEPAKTP